MYYSLNSDAVEELQDVVNSLKTVSHRAAETGLLPVTFLPSYINNYWFCGMKLMDAAGVIAQQTLSYREETQCVRTLSHCLGGLLWWQVCCWETSAPGLIQMLRGMEFGQDSHVNFPHGHSDLADDHPDDDERRFSAVAKVGQRPQGLLVTLFVNWVMKPFSMALLGLDLFRFLFSAWMSPAEADQYIAGAIILAAAPCSHGLCVELSDGW